MPGNVAAAAPSTVMPEFVSSAFELVSEFVVDVNAYQDASFQAQALTTTARKTWRATVPCTSALLTALRSFWSARGIEPFYYYYFRETTPLGSVDLTGTSTVGRYAVKFNNEWNEENTLGRNAINVEIVEVA